MAQIPPPQTYYIATISKQQPVFRVRESSFLTRRQSFESLLADWRETAGDTDPRTSFPLVEYRLDPDQTSTRTGIISIPTKYLDQLPVHRIARLRDRRLLLPGAVPHLHDGHWYTLRTPAVLRETFDDEWDIPPLACYVLVPRRARPDKVALARWQAEAAPHAFTTAALYRALPPGSRLDLYAPEDAEPAFPPLDEIPMDSPGGVVRKRPSPVWRLEVPPLEYPNPDPLLPDIPETVPPITIEESNLKHASQRWFHHAYRHGYRGDRRRMPCGITRTRLPDPPMPSPRLLRDQPPQQWQPHRYVIDYHPVVIPHPEFPGEVDLLTIPAFTHRTHSPHHLPEHWWRLHGQPHVLATLRKFAPGDPVRVPLHEDRVLARLSWTIKENP